MLLAGTAHAQQVCVFLSNGWVINGAQCDDSSVKNFSVNNGRQGAVVVSASAFAGTCPKFAYGSAAVQGYLISGAPVYGKRATTAGCIESYQHNGGGGDVMIEATVGPGQIANLVHGTTATGKARTAAAFTCPLFGWLRGSANSRAVYPPTLPVLVTPPMSARAAASGQTSFQIIMLTGAIAEGGVNSVGDAIFLHTLMNITGEVRLY